MRASLGGGDYSYMHFTYGQPSMLTPRMTPCMVEYFSSFNANLSGDARFLAGSYLLIFGIIFGFGHWLIKTHDTKKQFYDSFLQINETMFSNAVNLLLNEGVIHESGHSIFPSTQDNTCKSIGLNELIRLKNQQRITPDRIDRITGSKLNLINLNLYKSDLEYIDLSNANMRNTNLAKAILSNSKLSGTNLSNAKLNGAQLINAELQRANLSEAQLSGANLSGALLNGADLKKAHLIQGQSLWCRSF